MRPTSSPQQVKQSVGTSFSPGLTPHFFVAAALLAVIPAGKGQNDPCTRYTDSFLLSHAALFYRSSGSYMHYEDKYGLIGGGYFSTVLRDFGNPQLNTITLSCIQRGIFHHIVYVINTNDHLRNINDTININLASGEKCDTDIAKSFAFSDGHIFLVRDNRNPTSLAHERQ